MTKSVLVLASGLTSITFAAGGYIAFAKRRPAAARAYRQQRLHESLGLWTRSSRALYHLRYVSISAGAVLFALGVGAVVKPVSYRPAIIGTGIVLIFVGLRHTLGQPDN